MTLLTETSFETLTDDQRYAERRRGLRIHQTRPVKIFDQSANRYFGGQTQDVSSTGLKLEVPLGSPVREGETLNIHVGLSSSGQSLANRRQMMPARIVWVHRGRDLSNGKLTIGVEFLSSIVARLDAA